MFYGRVGSCIAIVIHYAGSSSEYYTVPIDASEHWDTDGLDSVAERNAWWVSLAGDSIRP